MVQGLGMFPTDSFGASRCVARQLALFGAFGPGMHCAEPRHSACRAWALGFFFEPSLFCRLLGSRKVQILIPSGLDDT